MERKKKMCAGFDGTKHEAYIYKNINGKKYCKACTLKLQGVKSIKKVSEKQKFKLTLKSELLELDKEFYQKLWFSRFDARELEPECEACKRKLPHEPNLMNFHHILEKRNYPEYRHYHWNIAVLCPECHNKYETKPDTVPYLVARKEFVLNHYHQIHKIR